jgi:probable F420-dependent oxidoreductase
VELGYSLTAFGLRPEEYAPITAHAEQEGFDTIWLGDHLITPVGYRSTYPYATTAGPGHPVETPLLDVWVNIGNLAAHTSKIRLASGVVILPLRHPFVTARAAASAQLLSGGRVLLGAGAGWLQEEFDALGEPFDERGARLEEAIEILRAIWSGGPVQHDGPAYRFGKVEFVPRPEPPIPILLGGLSKPALRRAARLGDGWYGPACSLDESLAARRAIEAERAAHGLTEPYVYYVRVAPPLNASVVRAYLDAGFDQLVVATAKLADTKLLLGEKLDAISRAGEAFREAV